MPRFSKGHINPNAPRGSAAGGRCRSREPHVTLAARPGTMTGDTERQSPLKSTAGAELLNLTAHAEQPSAPSSTSHTNPPRAERPPNDTSPVRPRKRPPSVGPAGPDVSQSTLGEIRQSVTLENRDDQAIAYRGHGTETDIRPTTVEGVVDIGESRNPRGDRSRAGPPARGHENRHLRRRAPRRTARDQPHDQDRETSPHGPRPSSEPRAARY